MFPEWFKLYNAFSKNWKFGATLGKKLENHMNLNEKNFLCTYSRVYICTSWKSSINAVESSSCRMKIEVSRPTFICFLNKVTVVFATSSSITVFHIFIIKKTNFVIYFLFFFIRHTLYGRCSHLRVYAMNWACMKGVVYLSFSFFSFACR